MSLQVWLPLCGNIENQGLADITFVNNSATVVNGGKIGQCYSFSANAYLAESTYDWTNFSTSHFSLCCWYKEPSPVASNNSQIMCIGTSSGWNNIRIGLLRRVTSGEIMFSVSDGSTAIQYGFTSSGFTLDVWHHIAVTYNSGNLCMYLDGTLNKTMTTTIVPVLNSSQHLGVGAASNGAEKLTGFLNDIRIYDHCLSQAEIYELAKAKLIHLKLSDNYNTIINVFNQPTFNNSAASAGWNHWGPSGHSGTYGQNTDKKYIFDKTQTYSHWVAEGHAVGTANMYYICYQSPAFEGGYRSVQFILKEQNGIPITDSVCIPNWNGVVSGSIPKKWTSIIPLGDGFYLCKCEGFQQTGSDDLVSILVFPGYKVYISQAVCEDNKQICGDIFRQGDLTNIYDCSGYRHDAIQNALTSSLDTARYESSAIFNGSSSYVKVNDTTWMADRMPAMTINLWAKNSAWGTNTHFFSCTEGGGFNTETGNSGYLRFLISVYTAATGTSYAYKFDSQELKLSDIPTDEWVMLTWVYDNFGTRTYINGELHHTYLNNSYGIHFNTGARLFLGCEANAANPSSPWYNGQMSDFRIYATAMSQADIRLLYRTSGFVDDQGNVFAGELREV